MTIDKKGLTYDFQRGTLTSNSGPPANIFSDPRPLTVSSGEFRLSRNHRFVNERGGAQTYCLIGLVASFAPEKTKGLLDEWQQGELRLVNGEELWAIPRLEDDGRTVALYQDIVTFDIDEIISFSPECHHFWKPMTTPHLYTCAICDVVESSWG